MKGKTVPILIIGIVAAAIIIAIIVFVTDDSQTTNTNTATTVKNTNTTANTNAAGNYGGGGPLISFADCVDYGGTVEQSYPRKCTTTDGELITEDIGNEIEKADLIKITSPKPNDKITSPVTITGQARGSWFFEGEFPLFIYDILHKLIGRGNATATGDWMTEEFVPFSATIEFTEPAYGPGLLYLNNSNPSDNPELDDALIIPIDYPLE